MKRLMVVWALAASLVIAPTAPAFAASVQPSVDSWGSQRDCDAAVSAPNYVPRTTTHRALGAGERVAPHPTGGCFEIDLPDRETKGYPIYGRGWVRIAPGTPVVFNGDGAPVRLAQCDNRIFATAPFSSENVARLQPPPEPMPEPTPTTPAPSTPASFGQPPQNDGLKIPPMNSEAYQSYGDERSYLDRNGKKIAIATGLVVLGAVLARLFMVQQEVNQKQCVNSPTCR